jgi:predicted ABC-type transport system involved in lysophospholipase L1 biosynthesis ATPase subunit
VPDGRREGARGTLTLDDRDITNLSPFARARAGLGYVPQGREIFPRLSVEENLLMGLAGKQSGGLKDLPPEIWEMFPVLNDMRHRRGGDLSGGQQQQLAIGRALAMRPRVLILDEPTEGIQPSIIKDIERAIRKLAQRGDMAILLVEQYYDFARRTGCWRRSPSDGAFGMAANWPAQPSRRRCADPPAGPAPTSLGRREARTDSRWRGSGNVEERANVPERSRAAVAAMVWQDGEDGDALGNPPQPRPLRIRGANLREHRPDPRAYSAKLDGSAMVASRFTRHRVGSRFSDDRRRGPDGKDRTRR